MSKDDLIKQLQDQVTLWRNKYEALAKLYSQLRTEHLDMLAKFKQMQLKANSAQEAIDKMERMERDLKAKNLELADMIRERDRARFDLDRQKSSHKDELDRVKRELNFANERAEDASRSKNSEVSHVLSKYNRQISELEDSLRVSSKISHLNLVSHEKFLRPNKFISTRFCLNSTKRITRSSVSEKKRIRKLLSYRWVWIPPSSNCRRLSRLRVSRMRPSMLKLTT